LPFDAAGIVTPARPDGLIQKNGDSNMAFKLTRWLAYAAASLSLLASGAQAQVTAGPGAWSSNQTWAADTVNGGNLTGYFYWPATQPTLAGLEGEAPPRKLRVRWAYGPQTSTIPKHKSVDDASPLADVLQTGSVDYRGATGLTGSTFQVSARHLPYHREGKIVERVLVLLRDSTAMA